MGRDPKEQKGKKTNGRELEESSINSEGKRLGWEGKGKQRRGKEEERRKGGGGGGRRHISYLRKPPQGQAAETPQTRPLLQPSPPDRPLPLCPARPGSVGFPAVGLFLKTPTPSPRPALTLWPQGPQPSPGTPPSCGEGRRGERRQAALGQQETPALGSEAPRAPEGREKGARLPAHTDCSRGQENWAPG